VLLAGGAGSAAGPLGFLIVLLLLVTTWLLIHNMNSRLKRLPKRFGEEPPEQGQSPAEEKTDE